MTTLKSGESLTAPADESVHHPADFPVFLRLAGHRALVVGGGAVALRKVRRLLRSDARVAVIAPSLIGELRELALAGAITHVSADFTPARLDGCRYAVAATDDHVLNAAVADAATRRGIFVNVVDDAELSSAISPAIVDRAPVTVSISTSGLAPVLARRLRERIEQALPARLGALARFMGAARPRLNPQLPPHSRRMLWERFLDGAGRDAALRGDDARASAALALAAAGVSLRGEVYLIGAGPGDPDLLTLRALRLMQQADAILYDRLLDPAILTLARGDAEQICVGKRCGQKGMPQAAINAELVRRARAGQRVARLKAGDPFIFGRGGEEAEELAAHGIPFQVVPGITAANGCAAYANIPLTHRDHASSCVFITGHTSATGELDLPWPSLARRDQTIVIYMALRSLPHLCQRLIDAGLPTQCPAVVIENGTRSDQRVLEGTLATLPRQAALADIDGPSLVIIGEVVSLRRRLSEATPPQSAAQAPAADRMAVSVA